jgi:ABC-type polysaccharide/polyol phosphate export permease
VIAGTGEHDAGFVLTPDAPPARALLGELWRSRALLAVLARKDFHVRYRRASFGLLWAVAIPLFQAVVLALVFTKIVRIRTEADYTVFVYAGVVAWSFFATTLGTASTAIVDGSGLSTKIYFPRAVLPLVSVAANLYGLGVGLGVLVGLALVRGEALGPSVVLLLPATVLLALLAATLSVLLAAVHVYFRDVRYLVQAALLAWFYMTPVVYPLSLSKRYAPWLAANPVTGPVELLRGATVGADERWLGVAVAWTVAWVVVLAAVGLVVHRRVDRVVADLL